MVRLWAFRGVWSAVSGSWCVGLGRCVVLVLRIVCVMVSYGLRGVGVKYLLNFPIYNLHKYTNFRNVIVFY